MFRGGERSVGLVVIRDVVLRTALGRPAPETARMLRGTFGVIHRFVSAGVSRQRNTIHLLQSDHP